MLSVQPQHDSGLSPAHAGRCKRFPVVMPEGFHPFPSRTRKLSPPRPMILLPRGSGKVGRCRDIKKARWSHDQRAFLFLANGPLHEGRREG